MPCPPSYEEQQAMRLDAISSITQRHHRDLEDSLELIQLLRACEESSRIPAALKEAIDRLGKRAPSLVKFSVSADILKPGPSSTEACEQLQSQMEPATRQMDTLREQLCRTRTVLIQLADIFEQIPVDLQQRFAEHRDAHIAHRKEDREFWLKNGGWRSSLRAVAKALPVEVLIREPDCLSYSSLLARVPADDAS